MTVLHRRVSAPWLPVLLLALAAWALAADAEPVRTRQPQAAWAAQAPAVAAYEGRLPAARRQGLQRFRARHPQTDPTDVQGFQAAVINQRAAYGLELSEAEAAQFHAWLVEAEGVQEAMVSARAAFTSVLESDRDADGAFYTLIGFDGPRPIYSISRNANAAVSTAANLVRMSNAFDPVVGTTIDGNGLYVNVNDHGTIYEHPEFQLPGGGSRIVYKEINDGGDRSHMTHVAGTVGAWGHVGSLMGMVPRAWIRSHIQQNTSDVTGFGMQYPGQRLATMNPQTGEPEMRSVMGTTSLGSTDTNANRGVYTYTASSFDQTLWDYPYYIHFYAASNDGSSYATIGTDRPLSKNVLTIASVSDVSRSTSSAYISGGSVSGFSSRGPAFDGRIKPDLSANGEGLTSPSSLTGTGSKSGTSMATPNASGSTVLLSSYFTQRFPGHFLRSSTLKALLVNTADDRGNAGPDYQYGWGIINVFRAAEILRRYAETPSSRVVIEDNLTSSQTWVGTYTYDGSGPIRVTLAWIDPAGAAQSASTADRTRRLVNDLNLRLVGPGAVVYQPFVMPFVTGAGPTAAFDSTLYGAVATTGTNTTDNAEQVLIAAPPAGTYSLQVSHAGTLSGGNQRFSLAITGMAQQAPIAPTIASLSPSTGAATDNQILTITGSGYLLGSDVILRRAGSDDVIAYGEQVIAGQITCRIDAALLAKGYWDVYVRAPDGSEIRLSNAFLLPATGLPPIFTSTPPTQRTVGQALTYAITTSDADTAASSLVLTATGLPAGMSFAANGSGGGTISGAATSSGTSTVRISVSDGTYTTWQIFNLVIVPVSGNTAPAVATSTLPDAHVSAAYAATVTTSDADGHALVLSVGSHPAWMTFVDQGSGTALCGGTPPSGTNGSYSVVVNASDGLTTTSRTLSLTVRPKATVAFSSASFTVAESAGGVGITISRSGNNYGAASVICTTSNGTATAGSDYTATTSTVNWADGDTATKTVTVPILEDLLTEGSQNFTVMLSAPTGIAELGTSTATVTITDNDNNTPPVVSLTRPSPAVIGISGTQIGLMLQATVSDDGKPLAPGTVTRQWTQVQGPGSAVFANPAVADTSVSFPLAGDYVLRLTANDGEFSGSDQVTVRVGAAPAITAGSGLLRELWSGISGATVANLTGAAAYPNSPTSSGLLTGGFTSPASAGDNYGQRVHGYFVPPATGSYVFYIASDDSSELWLGTSSAPGSAVPIASVSGSTSSAQWTKFSSQQSAAISLVAGTPYYIRALHKEGTGGDFVMVRAVFPDSSDHAPIDNAYLAAFDSVVPTNYGATPVLPVLSAQVAGGAFALGGSVSDDGIPGTGITTQYSLVSGPGSLILSAATDLASTANASASGSYLYRLTADDGQVATFVDRTVSVTGGTPVYAVTYSANGATSGTAPGDQAKTQGVALTLATNSGSLAKTGSIFAGWNTAADGSGVSYAAGASYTVDAALTLFARWTVLPTYAVTYNANGATGGAIPSAQTKVQGVDLTLATNSGGLVKTGSAFAGWNTAADGSGTTYAAGALYTLDAAATLYAQWTLLPTYAVTYNANGATAGTAPGAQTKTQGVALTLALNSGSLAKAGSTFAGWNTAADGSGTTYATGATYTTDAALVLYAKWTLLPTYIVTYAANGATGGSAPGSQIKTQGVNLTLALNTGGLVKTGSVFAGWNTAANGSGTAYAVGSVYAADAAVTLYAQWALLPTYAVTYNSNGASSGTIPAAQTKTQGIDLILALNSGSLAKTGATFAGWNTAADGSGTGYAVGASYAVDAAVTLYASWSALPTYAVTYNANGATSGTAPGAQSKIQGVNLILAANTGSLAKSGSTFAGWNTAANGSGTGYAAGAVYSADATVVLYATWTVLPTYAVTYDANGATSGSPPASQTKTQGVSLSLATNTGSLAKTGSTFAGWNTAADGSGSGYAAGATYNADAAVTLYATWTALPTYAVTYSANGATSGTAPGTQSKTQGVNLTLALNSGSLAKTGATFTGWNTAANGTGTAYAAGAVYATDAALTLYAAWTVLPTYAVTYNANGATGGTAPAAQSKIQGINLTLASNSGGLVKSGSTFAGWNTAANGSGTSFAVGATYSVDAALTLYAAWTTLPTYAVTYNANGATSGTAPSAQTKTQGVTLTLAGNTGSLAKVGSVFAGWNTATDGSGTAYAAGAAYTGNAALTLYAAWTVLPTYAVTYDANGATSGTAPTAQSKTQGVDLALAVNSGGLTKAGSTFAGWNTASDGSGTGYAAGGTYAADAAVTLYAAWTVLPTYAVTYVGNGSDGGVVPNDVNAYLTGATVLVQGNTGGLYRDGYAFAGWNTQADGSGSAYVAGNSFLMATADVILYAAWSVLPTYGVTYAGNGNDAGSVPVDGSSYLTGADVIVLGNSGALTRSGYTFAGWNTAADGSSTSRAPGAVFPMGTSAVVLYAQWTLVGVPPLTPSVVVPGTSGGGCGAGGLGGLIILGLTCMALRRRQRR